MFGVGEAGGIQPKPDTKTTEKGGQNRQNPQGLNRSTKLSMAFGVVFGGVFVGITWVPSLWIETKPGHKQDHKGYTP